MRELSKEMSRQFDGFANIAARYTIKMQHYFVRN